MQKLFENWRYFLKEAINSYSGVKEEVYKSYKSGANRDPWTDGSGLLRRKVFGPAAPQNIVDEYYNDIILPQIRKVIFFVDIRPARTNPQRGWRATTHYEPDREGGRGIVWDAEEEGMSAVVFQHELGHAIDYQIDLLLAFKNNKKNKFTRFLIKDFPGYARKTLGGHQMDIFHGEMAGSRYPAPGLFDLPFGDNVEHCAREGEIYTSITMQRKRQKRPYTLKDIGDFESAWEKMMRDQPDGWKFLSDEVDDINVDLICAIKKYRTKGLSDEQIVILLNRIAKLEKIKTSMMTAE